MKRKKFQKTHKGKSVKHNQTHKYDTLAEKLVKQGFSEAMAKSLAMSTSKNKTKKRKYFKGDGYEENKRDSYE